MQTLPAPKPFGAIAVVVATSLFAGAACAAADDEAAPGGAGTPRAFVQLGAAEDATRSLTLGIAWPGGWQRQIGHTHVQLHWEASFGRWSTKLDEGTRSSAWVTQVGVTPAIRWQPIGSAWFGEIGIGVNALLPVFRSRDKQFSTAFNFGDHLAVGRQFGEGRRQELSLRYQHFSNGGIRRPNPGEDFLQLRYAHGF
jgi:lipid A 3-O-deacylase